MRSLLQSERIGTLATQSQRHPGWPRNPRQLTSQVQQIQSNLRTAGWDIHKVSQRHYEVVWVRGDGEGDGE